MRWFDLTIDHKLIDRQTTKKEWKAIESYRRHVRRETEKAIEKIDMPARVMDLLMYGR